MTFQARECCAALLGPRPRPTPETRQSRPINMTSTLESLSRGPVGSSGLMIAERTYAEVEFRVHIVYKLSKLTMSAWLLASAFAYSFFALRGVQSAYTLTRNGGLCRTQARWYPCG